MKKIKSFFETPFKAVVSSICIIAVLAVLGAGTAFAASAIAKSSAIGTENAQNFAFADAGDPVSAQVIRTEFEFEHGQFVYEVEFMANGTEYDYWIKASDGSVVKKEIEIVSVNGDKTSVTAQITLDEAKEIALTDAGLTVSDVTFTKTKLDKDDQLSVYDVSFSTADAKYEYEINANTGNVYSKSKESVAQPSNQQPVTGSDSAAQQTQNTQQSATTNTQTGNSAPSVSTGTQANQPVTSTSNGVSLETAKSTALSDAGVTASSATFTKAKQDYDDGVLVYDIEFYTSTHKYDYEVNASTGKIVSRDAEAFQTGGGNAGSSSTYIGVDSAKSAALSHAGLSASSVTFSKAKLDNDDGYVVYEIEFYYNNMEYEYKIDAVSGAVLEYDSERD